MSRVTTASRRVLPAAAILMLMAACAPTTGGSTSTPAATTAPAGGGGIDECILGEWSTDLQSWADQMTARYEALGVAAVVIEVTGSQVTLIEPGTMHWDTEVTFDMSGTIEGHDINLVQIHSGPTDIEWMLDADQLTFVALTTDPYDVTNQVTINGIAGPTAPFDLERHWFSDFPMAVTCSDDTLVVGSAPSPYTTTLHRL